MACHIVSPQKTTGFSSFSSSSSSAFSKTTAVIGRRFRKAQATPFSAFSSKEGPRPIAIPMRCQRISSCAQHRRQWLA